MTILARKTADTEASRNLREALITCNRLRKELAEVGSERDALRDQLDGKIPEATYWLQVKVWRQRRALDQLNRRTLSLRFALRLMNSIREPVTTQEWVAARNAIGSHIHDDDGTVEGCPGCFGRDRVDEKPPAE
jgi:hypothetical protein